MAIPEGLASYLWVGAASVLAPTVFGLGLLRWLGLTPAHGRRCALGFAYVVGHFVLAHVTLVWLWCGQPGPGCLLPGLAAAVGVALWRTAARRDGPPARHPASPWWSWLPLVLVALCCIDTFTAANAEPVRFSDEALNWAAKAKVLYTAPGFDLQEGLHFFVEHPDYPLFNPLAQVLAFASAGRVLHFENRLPIQFFAIALLSLLSSAMARRAHPAIAALVLLAFAGSSFAWQAPTVYADVMLACCTLAAAEALLRWRETDEPVFVAIAGLALGAMVSTKNEGTLLAAAVAVPFAVDLLWRRHRGVGLRWRLAGWLAVPVAAWLLHRGINARYGIVNDLVNPELDKGRGLLARIVDQAGERAIPVLQYYGRMLVDPETHRLLPLAWLVASPVAACLDRRSWFRGPVALLTFACLFAIAGYMSVFVGTPHDLKWHLDTAAERTMQHVLPLVASALAAAVSPARYLPAGALSATASSP